MLEKLKKLKNWQAAAIITLLGFAVYFDGLKTPFQGDDILQIVNNTPVHSISHIKLFFEGGTFYHGNGIAPLTGVYFRPLMSTVFSLIYSLFSAQPFYFHLLQLLLCIGSAIILYLFLRYSFKPPLAIFIALVFLVHPIDSQVVFYIAQLQDALFFFFGILALYLLIRLSSIKSLGLVALCLILSLLAKETGILFVIMALLYLFWWNRKRLFAFIGVMVLPLALYVMMRIHAVGIFKNPYGAPIDRLDLLSRLFTAPSIMLFYITKFIFPWKLATTYYWTYPRFSFSHFLIPLLIDLAVIGLIIYLAYLVRKKAPKAMFYTYLFFAVWCALGILASLQIIPLDSTATEPWFYFPMVGVLGMIGVLITVFPLRLSSRWLLIATILLIGVLGARTVARGLDWSNPYKLALMDISNSADNYKADYVVANQLTSEGNYSKAKFYQEQGIRINPTYSAYVSLGAILENLHQYSGSKNAYEDSFKYADSNYIYETYEGLGGLTLLTGSSESNYEFLLSAIDKYPRDSTLWFYLAILEDRYNDNADARLAISNAAKYGQVDPNIYENIMYNQAFSMNVAGSIIKFP